MSFGKIVEAVQDEDTQFTSTDEDNLDPSPSHNNACEYFLSIVINCLEWQKKFDSSQNLHLKQLHGSVPRKSTLKQFLFTVFLNRLPKFLIIWILCSYSFIIFLKFAQFSQNVKNDFFIIFHYTLEFVKKTVHYTTLKPLFFKSLSKTNSKSEI